MRKKQPQIVLQRKGRAELERLLADGNTAQKIAKRARIVLMSADGHGVMATMREAGVSKTTPIDVCQPPLRTELLSQTMCRAPARISAHVISTVGVDR